ncbi:carboxypeptidase regulatory-like domain-containing protein [Schlesneria sp.]|uniref:carboxypeptidase regulatory-like domain-containing protein n=1 Tax=Schlesneria sp. TaxID=2762018 RepID=UPI002EFC2EF2
MKCSNASVLCWAALVFLVPTLIESVSPTVVSCDLNASEDQPQAQNSASTIAGHVLNHENKPVNEAVVALYRFHSPSQRFGHFVPVASPATTDISGFFQFETLADGYYLIVVQAKGYARSHSTRTINDGPTHSTADIRMQFPVKVAIDLKDEAGQPIQGARIRSFNISGMNGSIRATQMLLRDLNDTFPVSDQAGRIVLADFPLNETLRITIAHPTFAPIVIEELKITNGVVASAVLRPGVVLTFQRKADELEERIENAVLDLRHSNFESPSTMLQYEVDFDSSGKGSVTIEPGDYEFLRLQHDDFYLTPTLHARHGKLNPNHPLHFEAGKNVELRFEVHRRLVAKGRVIDAESGEPVAEQSLIGKILTGVSSDEQDQTEFNFTGWGDTNAQGEFTVPVAAGRMRVEFNGTNYLSDTEFIDFDVAADGSTVIPDIKVRSLPKLQGVVRDQDGMPAARVVVRIRGQIPGSKNIADPVLTDDQGRFEIQPTYVLRNDQTNQRQLDYSVVAFDPFRPFSGRVDVKLDESKPIELSLEPHDFDWPLTEFEGELSEWERGNITVEKAAENDAHSLRGQPIPELDFVEWINSEPLDRAKFRGHYVLLDFWFIGCGPCHAEFPVVKMLHELYHDRGLIVIGVHNNNDPPEKVRQHVQKIGLPYPIAVDHPDGRTVRAFQSHRLVEGFPSYVLIDPEGNVLLDDRTIPHPSLRGYKLEILRKLLFRQSPE